MTYSIGRDWSSIGTAIGATVALLAVVGTQVLGWEWGDGRLVPTVIGLAAAAIAVAMFLRRRG